MKLKDYIALTLGAKYGMVNNDRAASLAATVVTIMRQNGLEFGLLSAPKLDLFEDLSDYDMHHVFVNTTNSKVSGALFRMMRASSREQATEILIDMIHLEDAAMSIAGLAVSSELVGVGAFELGGEPVEQLGGEDAAKIVVMGNGTDTNEGTWLKTGIIEVEGVTYNLVETNDGKVPAEVQVARIFFCAKDPVSGIIGAQVLEKVAGLLARFMVDERRSVSEHIGLLNSQLQQATAEKAPRESIWPADQTHWIYDPQWARDLPAFPTPLTHPLREQLVTEITNAAKYALSRASGMGTARVLNIEGLIDNVAIGLLGNGGEEQVFDWAAFGGKPKKPAVVKK